MFLAGLGIGFVIGWVVFKRPDWATNLLTWIKDKIGLGGPATGLGG